jgi:hypothetical protein
MRACEGCRRRKIKCDSATTNTWPCSACIRLKLHCVPPAVNYDQSFSSNPQDLEQDRGEYEGAGHGEEAYQQQMAMQDRMVNPTKNVPPIYTQQMPYSQAVDVYQPVSYGEPSSGHNQQSMHFDHIQTPVSIIDQHQHYSSHPVFPTPPLQQSSQSVSTDTYEKDQYGQGNLADVLGLLKINEAGTGDYSSVALATHLLIHV